MIWQDWAILVVLVATLGLYLEQIVFLPFLLRFRLIGGFPWVIEMVRKHREIDEKIASLQKELDDPSWSCPPEAKP